MIFRRGVKRLVFFMLIFSLCLSCSSQNKLQTAELLIEKKDGTEPLQKITAELAITDAQQTKGFMERKTIPEGTGMIFIYKTDMKMRFWMKNTPHPLSIAFIDSTGVIREIFDMAPYSLDVTASAEAVRYALEVPQGMFIRMGIQEGDKLSKETVYLLKRKALGY